MQSVDLLISDVFEMKPTFGSVEEADLRCKVLTTYGTPLKYSQDSLSMHWRRLVQNIGGHEVRTIGDN